MAEATNPITTASNPRVGEDWVLVPREPTPEMIFAAAGVRPGDLSYPAKAHMLRFDYRAMIASAPSPEAGAGGDLGTGSDLLDALHRVAKAAKSMPRETPAPGGAGTMHSFSIEAGVVWDLDRALDHLAVIQAGYSTGKYRSGKLVASTGSGEETKGAP